MTTDAPDVETVPLAALVRADRLALAHLFASTEANRYYLNGVCLRRAKPAAGLDPVGGVSLCGTNGHVLGLFRDDEGEIAREMIVQLPPEALRLCRKPVPAKRWRDANNNIVESFAWFGIAADEPALGRVLAAVVYAPDADGARLLMMNARATAEWYGVVTIIDGTFPAYERVVPHSVPVDGGAAPLSAHVLAPFFKIGNPVTIMPAGAGMPVLVHCARPDFIGVAMPMRAESLRVENGHFVPPGWAGGRAPGKAPAKEKAA